MVFAVGLTTPEVESRRFSGLAGNLHVQVSASNRPEAEKNARQQAREEYDLHGDLPVAQVRLLNSCTN